MSKVDPGLLLDILSDGMDYAARGFWAQINNYKWEWWYKEDGRTLSILVKPDTSLIQMRDDEDGEADTEDRPWVDITLDKLEEATLWAVMTENYSHLFSSVTINKGVIEEIDYDAIGADCIIQKIVLGSVMYG